jgi:hypothetical protein
LTRMDTNWLPKPAAKRSAPVDANREFAAKERERTQKGRELFNREISEPRERGLSHAEAGRSRIRPASERDATLPPTG